MGFRTVVILSNDQANEWIHDSNLGRMIVEHAHHDDGTFRYGKVVECVHNDLRSLLDVDSMTATRVASTNWYHGCKNEDQRLRLLKQFADSMGYTIRRKSK